MTECQLSSVSSVNKIIDTNWEHHCEGCLFSAVSSLNNVAHKNKCIFLDSLLKY